MALLTGNEKKEFKIGKELLIAYFFFFSNQFQNDAFIFFNWIIERNEPF